MILIADSGSTKADWVLIDHKKIQSKFQTDGLNPVHLSEEVIFQKLSSEKNISSNAENISEVHFFGAGCGNADGMGRMEMVLKKILSAAKVTVENDLMAAALATCGNEKGIVSILGTGSNCCYYDGSSIHVKNFGLGYILGDEGSGTWFGKKIFRAFLYGQLPEKINSAFVSEYNLNREQIIESVYRKPNVNLFLSSFMPFIAKHKEESFMKKLLTDGLIEFFDTNISGFPESKHAPLHFVGSIAALLEKEIREIGKEKKLSIRKIIKRPMDGLANYFISK